DFMRAKDHEGGELQVSGFHQTKTGQTNLTLATEKLHIMSADILRGVLDARLDLTGEIKAGYSLTGEIKPEQLDVTIPESISGNIPQLNVAVKGDSEEQQKTTPPIAQNLELDIDFIAPRRIMVRGWGLDAEFGGNIQIKGSAAQPLFYGDLQARRGRYTEFGKVFKFTTANMNFAGSIPPSPTLDIETQTKAGDITAIITITGPVLSPKINFSSSPPLPEDEVMSHILFGEKMEDISPFQAVQLARTLNRFTGAGGQAGSALGNFDPIGSLRAATGLDELRIETSEEGGASIGAGKYLTDKVYLEFESGTEEGAGSANVQVELTPNITIESEVGQDSGGGAGIFWKWDY
ncbi:MAG: translocation/assembly module TamB domain-containing protein, partial [Alphaproteobacteria bacterium]